MVITFHKPFAVLSQFTRVSARFRTLADYELPKNVYPIDRLDADSEGLLLLSDEKRWNDLLLHPRHAHERTYHAQVEGRPTEDALRRIRTGVVIQGYRTLPCAAQALADPGYPPRIIPIRSRPNRPHPLFKAFVESASKTIREGEQRPLPLEA